MSTVTGLIMAKRARIIYGTFGVITSASGMELINRALYSKDLVEAIVNAAVGVGAVTAGVFGGIGPASSNHGKVKRLQREDANKRHLS